MLRKLFLAYFFFFFSEAWWNLHLVPQGGQEWLFPSYQPGLVFSTSPVSTIKCKNKVKINCYPTAVCIAKQDNREKHSFLQVHKITWAWNNARVLSSIPRGKLFSKFRLALELARNGGYSESILTQKIVAEKRKKKLKLRTAIVSYFGSGGETMDVHW